MSESAQKLSPSDVRIPPRYSRGIRVPMVSALVMSLVLAAGGAVLFWFDPNQHSFYPYCFLHRTTGLLCPGCGGLRSVHQLLHGHFVAAFRLNALFVLSLPFLGWFGVRCVLAQWRSQPAPAIRPAWLWTAFALMAIFGIARNLPFAHLACLAP